MSEDEKPEIPDEAELKKNWQPSIHQGIYKKINENKWLCVECGQEFTHPRTMGLHAKGHQKPKTSTSQQHEISSTDELLELRKKDLARAQNYELETTVGGDGEGEAGPDYDMINFDLQSQYKISNLIVNHPQFKFIFTDLRKRRMLFPQWDYATWIFECVNFWLTRHGVKPTAEIPEELIGRDPMIAKYLMFVADEWKKHEDEQIKVES